MQVIWMINGLIGYWEYNKMIRFLKRLFGNYPIIERDNMNRITYFASGNGYWEKSKYNDVGLKIYWETSNNFWSKQVFDSNNNRTHYTNSCGSWIIIEYDEHGNKIHYENSKGFCHNWKYDSNSNLINNSRC